jgi:cytochrome c-type biogenesis protein CcmH/NrfG
VNVARQVDPRRHPFSMNRAFYWIHSGRALSKLPGRGDDAVRALRTAERIQPTTTLRNQGVREVLGEMLTSGSARTMGLELRGMAHRAGVLTEDHLSD